MQIENHPDVRKKLKIFSHAEQTGNVSHTCRYFGISRDTFYRWKKNQKTQGLKGLIDSKKCPQNPNIRVAQPIEEKILYLRKHYHFGPTMIVYHLKRYHDMIVSEGGVRGVLLRHKMNRLPQNMRRRSLRGVKRYEKRVPGHHIQVDVKFLKLKDKQGKTYRRFQYTAIDDATRIRALKIYTKHTQANAINFINYVVDKFPFRIKVIRTDNGHEFQTKFNCHVQELGMIHVHIKPRSPHLNGKVERSHLTDQQEFYQLLTYKGDVDLHKKIKDWENYYNLFRPHSAHKGKTPYEALKIKLAV